MMINEDHGALVFPGLPDSRTPKEPLGTANRQERKDHEANQETASEKNKKNNQDESRWINCLA